MFGRTYSIVVRDMIDGIKLRGEFNSPRLFLMFYYAYKERLASGETIEAYIDGAVTTVYARPAFVDRFLDRLARTTP